MSASPLSIRLSTKQDREVLSTLDHRARRTGRALIAERDGVAIAAVALTSGSVIAHPSQPAGDTVRVLRKLRYRLMRQSGEVMRLASLTGRLTPRPLAS
jgi:hypothetical protein